MASCSFKAGGGLIFAVKRLWYEKKPALKEIKSTFGVLCWSSSFLMKHDADEGCFA